MGTPNDLTDAELPRSWALAQFDLLLTNATSSERKLPQNQYREGGRFPIVDQGVADVGGFTDDDTLVHPGPYPCIVFGDHTRCLKYVQQAFVQGADGVKVLLPHSQMEPKYLLWVLRALELPSRGYGRHFAALRDRSIRVAPFAEQRRIVEAIETHFSWLDAAVATLERVRVNLRRYRAAVLQSAVEGRLEGNHGSAIEGDTWVPLRECIVSIDQGWSPLCDKHPCVTSDEWGVIKTTSVQPMVFSDSDHKRLPPHFAPRPGIEVRSGDLLVTRAGPRSRVGIACLVRHSRPRLMVCDKVYRLRIDESRTVAAFVELVLNSPALCRSLDSIKSGISDSGVNLTQERFLDLLVPLPPVDRQQSLAAEVDRQLSIVESVDRIVTALQARTSRLRRSVLRVAFEGRLVSQDPCDEPASVLLDRLRCERAAMSSSLKKKLTRSPR